jgi:cell division protein YceG involved in septum cleavage
MEESHDIILIIIIGAIILLQFYVFFGNYRKIQDYKKTIKKTKNFEIVEVSVPEEWIKDIEVDDILKDTEAFQKISSDFSSHIKPSKSSGTRVLKDEIDLADEEVDSNDSLFEDDDFEDYSDDDKN